MQWIHLYLIPNALDIPTPTSFKIKIRAKGKVTCNLNDTQSLGYSTLYCNLILKQGVLKGYGVVTSKLNELVYIL